MSSTGTPATGLCAPKYCSIRSRGNRSIPAGTGVWVVNSVPARVTSRAVAKSRPRAVLGDRELPDPLQPEESGVALVGVEHLGLLGAA